MIPRRTALILAVGCGLSVANLYYNQPLLAGMAASLDVPPSRISLIATLSQVGYALGLFLFVPLGDLLERRSFILAMLGAVTVASLAVAVAPGFNGLAIASLALGAATIVPQLIVPFAAGLADPSERGKVVGTVMSGLLIGILAARTVSGVVGAQFGWRAMYALAALPMIALAVAFRALLPRSVPNHPGLTYPGLLRSMVGLFASEPVLRQSCLFGMLAFGAFSAFWTTLSFYLARPPYQYGSDRVGLLGLVGIAGALAAPLIGRFADQGHPRRAIGLGLLCMLAAFGLFYAVGDRLWGLIAGILLLDLGLQSAHVTNMARIYDLPAEARSRLNTVYMVTFFCGGAAGSGMASIAWDRRGWGGVCLVATALLAAAVVGFVATAPRPRVAEPVG